MKKLLAPIACLVVGFLVGALIYPGPYSYGSSDKGASFRVNRLTGVQQFASSKGWVSEQELVRDSMGAVFGGMKSGFEAASEQK